MLNLFLKIYIEKSVFSTLCLKTRILEQQNSFPIFSNDSSYKIKKNLNLALLYIIKIKEKLET